MRTKPCKHSIPPGRYCCACDPVSKAWKEPKKEKKRGAIPQGGDDVVLTPDPLALAIVEHFQPAGSFLDPCAGEGAFMRAAEIYNMRHTPVEFGIDTDGNKWRITTPRLTSIHGMEIREIDGEPGQDFLKDAPPLIIYDWIVTNPPWGLFMEFLQRGMEIADNIVYLIHVNAAFTNARMDAVDAAGYRLAEIARVERPEDWQSMGLQLAALHFRSKTAYPNEDHSNCRITRLPWEQSAL